MRAGCAAARHVVAWSRAHPQEAALLLYGAGDFGRANWPEEHARRAERGDRRVRTALTRLGAALGVEGAQGAERLALAVIELPLSLVRRHLRAGRPLPAHAEALAAECAASLLAPRAG